MMHVNIHPNELPNLITVQVINILNVWNYQRKTHNQLWRKVIPFPNFFFFKQKLQFQQRNINKTKSFVFD